MKKSITLVLILVVLMSSLPRALAGNSVRVDIKLPSSYAGLFDNPKELKIQVFVSGTSQAFSLDDFNVSIGGKGAKILSFVHEVLDFDRHLYIIGVLPPKQEFPGSFDLQISFPLENVVLYNTITYSGKNVDLVFLVDGSGSMNVNDPKEIRKEGVKLLLNKLDIGDAVSIIGFDTHAYVLFPLQVISNETLRKEAIEAVKRIGAYGNTNIQEALNLAYAYLLNSSTGNSMKAVILLTDGYNTVGTLNETAIIKEFKERGWPIYTIALTGQADERLLRKLAEETGGIYLKAERAEDLLEIYNRIKLFVKNEVSLKSESGTLNQGISKEGDIQIGEGIQNFEVTVVGRGMSLALYFPNGSVVQLDPNSPTGTKYPNIYYLKGEDYQFYRVLNPQPGVWKYRITAESGGQYHLSASASAQIRLIPEVRTIIENGTVIIAGRLVKNGTEVVKTATITAVISGDSGEKTIPATFREDFSLDGFHFVESYVAIVRLDPGNYTVKLVAKMPDGTVLNSEPQSFTMASLEEIYRGEGYIVATDGISRTYLLNFKREVLWSYETGLPYVAHIHRGLVAVGSTGVYLFNITGDFLWDHQFGSPVTAVTIEDNNVSVAVGMTVYLFTLDGRLIWKRELPPKNGPIKGMYSKENRIYVVQEKAITVLDNDGNVVGTIDIPDVRKVVPYFSKALGKVVEVLLDAMNNIHVSIDFKVTVNISVNANVTVVLPVEVDNNDYIAIGTSNGVQVYDERGNKMNEVPTEDAVIKLVFYEKYLIAGTRNGDIYVLLVKNGTVVKEFQTGSKLVDMRVVELEDGAYILAKCLDGIHLFKLETNEVPSGGNVKYWIKTYGGSDYDWANAVAIAPNGDIIVAGGTESFGAGGWDFWVLRLDKNGDVKWQKTYGGSGDDEAYAVAIAPNGDIIVAGYTWSFGAGSTDVWVLRLDEHGNVKWQKTYGRSNSEVAKDVHVLPSGDILVAGVTNSFGAGGRDLWMLKLDSNGDVIWQKSYGGSTDDGSVSDLSYGRVIVTGSPDGYTYLVGDTTSFGAGRGDVWVLKLDSSGNVVWQKTYGGSSWERPQDVAVTDTGDLIIAAWSYSFGSGNDDLWILYLDGNGNIKWQKVYGGSNYDFANGIHLTPAGDIIVTGGTKSFGNGNFDFWTLNINKNGNVKWQKTYGGKYHDEAEAVAIADNGDIIVTGWTYSFGSGNDDVWVLRLPSNGELPNCVFCQESYAQVENSNAHVESTNAKVKTSNAEVYETNAEVYDTNAQVKTLWGRTVTTGTLRKKEYTWLSIGGKRLITKNGSPLYLITLLDVSINDETAILEIKNIQQNTSETIRLHQGECAYNNTLKGFDINFNSVFVGIGGNIHARLVFYLSEDMNITALGTLTFESTPSGASVYLNGDYKGTTPLTLSLPPGNYSIRLSKSNYYDYITTVALSSDEEKTITATLTPKFGYLKITTEPSGAKVYINGTYSGETPLTLKLKPGTYKVRLAKKDYGDYSTIVDVISGKTATISTALPPKFGYLTLYSSPPDAEVYINGVWIGNTPLVNYRLSVGPHTIVLKKEGYEDYRINASIKVAKLLTINATLSPRKGMISINSTPSGATVIIDGKEVGITPLEHYPLPIGFHRVILRKVNYAEELFNVSIQGGKELTFNVRLHPVMGIITIVTYPSGAEVYVDDRKIGKTPLENFSIPVGNHTIVIKKTGYKNKTLNVFIKSGESLKFTYILTPISTTSSTTTSKVTTTPNRTTSSPSTTPLGKEEICGPGLVALLALIVLVERRKRG